MSGLLIIGAGGHGKVVADTANDTGQWDKIAFIDDRHPILNRVLDWPVLGRVSQTTEFNNEYPDLAIAIGCNALRVSLLKQYMERGFRLPYIIHPTAFVSKFAQVAAGSVIFAQAAVNMGAVIGFGNIINTGATVDHDCILQAGVHISPGAHLAGAVHVGEYSWLGIGSAVIQQVTIGENVIVGAGTVVIQNIPNHVTVVGNPGRVSRNERGEQ